VENPDPPYCENLVISGNFFASDAKTSGKEQIILNHYGFIMKPEKVGTSAIGPVSIKYTNKETGEEKSLSTSPISITITRPLKDNLYLLKISGKYIGFALIIALITFSIINFIKKKRLERKRLRELESLPTLEEIYVKDLKSIYATLQTIGKKEYCSKISQTLKKYIEEKFDIKLTGATSDSIFSMTTTIDLLKQESVDLLISIFDFCDNVKFAGSEPTKENMDNLQFKAESFITNMKEQIDSKDRGKQDE
ncbi:hypothetical protein KKB18_11880, partial [bacterium]|nr:hypothetical protein [bacterium]